MGTGAVQRFIACRALGSRVCIFGLLRNWRFRFVLRRLGSEAKAWGPPGFGLAV